MFNESEIEYNIDIESYSDYEFFKDKSFWISLHGLSSAVSSMAKKELRIFKFIIQTKNQL